MLSILVMSLSPVDERWWRSPRLLVEWLAGLPRRQAQASRAPAQTPWPRGKSVWSRESGRRGDLMPMEWELARRVSFESQRRKPAAHARGGRAERGKCSAERRAFGRRLRPAAL